MRGLQPGPVADFTLIPGTGATARLDDVAATLAEKGFPRSPLKIIEICNAKYDSQALNRDVSLMLPCPISVFIEQDKTHISTFLPSSISQFFPEAGIEQLSAEVEAIVLQIVDESR